MTRYRLLIYLALVLTITAPRRSYADDGHLQNRILANHCEKLWIASNDTVPDIKKIPEAGTDSASGTSVIKVVPKSRKQIAPIAVPVTIDTRPLKIIKPKIIKPVIRIN